MSARSEWMSATHTHISVDPEHDYLDDYGDLSPGEHRLVLDAGTGSATVITGTPDQLRKLVTDAAIALDLLTPTPDTNDKETPTR